VAGRVESRRPEDETAQAVSHTVLLEERMAIGPGFLLDVTTPVSVFIDFSVRAAALHSANSVAQEGELIVKPWENLCDGGYRPTLGDRA
jgi:hypothetical protein